MPTRRSQRTKTAPGGQAPPGDLAAEIAALRGMLRQIRQLGDDDLPPDLRMRLLDIYSRAAGRLASLLKTQQNLSGSQDAGDALATILAEVIADIGRNKARFPDP